MEYLHNVYFSHLNVVVNNGGFIQIKPETQWHCEKDKFNQNKFYYVTKGQFSIAIEGKEYTAKAGDWFFIPANCVHSYANSKVGFEKFWMHFDLYPSDTDLFTILHLPHLIHAPQDKEVFSLFSKYANVSQTDITAHLQVKSYLLQLLIRYITLAGKRKITFDSDSDERINILLRHIHENLSEKLSNETLAAMCYLHPNHFIRFFKKKTGHTPADYIKQTRMETAKHLLENSTYSMLEIADHIGINDVGYFSKQFKRYFSMSPREYRKYYQINLLPPSLD